MSVMVITKKIKTLFLMFSGLNFIVLGFLISVSYNNLRKVEKPVNDILQHPFVVRAEAYRLSKNVLLYHHLYNNAKILDQDVTLYEYYLRKNELLSKIEHSLSAIEGNFLGEKAHVTELKQLIADVISPHEGSQEYPKKDKFRHTINKELYYLFAVGSLAKNTDGSIAHDSLSSSLDRTFTLYDLTLETPYKFILPFFKRDINIHTEYAKDAITEQVLNTIMEEIRYITDFAESKTTEFKRNFSDIVSVVRSSYLDSLIVLMVLYFAASFYMYRYSMKLIEQEKYSRQILSLASSVFDNSREGFMVIDTSHTIVLVNEAMRTLLGFSIESIQGENVLESKCLGKLSGFKEIWKETLANNGWRGEIIVYKYDETAFSGYLSIDLIDNIQHKTQVTPKFILKLFDISDRKKLEAEIMYMAQYDELTKLPNRRFLTRFLQNLIRSHVRSPSLQVDDNEVTEKLTSINKGAMSSSVSFALLFIDTDKFKHVNDTYGHNAGDSLLKQIAERIRSSIRSSDFASRYGGDAFIVILRDVNEKVIKLIVDKIYSVLSDTEYLIESDFQHISFSMGICLFPRDSTSEDDIINKADDAMYNSKKQGGCRITYWEEFKTQSPVYKLERDLTNLIKTRDFSDLFLVYQPQVSITENTVVGCEALLRWRNGDEIVNPAVFIPIMESTNFIIPVGSHVLRTACREFVSLIKLNECNNPDCKCNYTVSVNISVKQIRHPDFVPFIIGVLKEYSFPQLCLELEITESIFTDDLGDIVSTLKSIKSLGVKIAIDDFGAGYSSLSRLVHLPIDKIKIDAEFMRELDTNENSRKIVNSVVQIGKTLKLKVIAEGVETYDQLSYLKSIECDQIQGYFFSKPLLFEDYVKWLEEESWLRRLDMINS